MSNTSVDLDCESTLRTRIHNVIEITALVAQVSYDGDNNANSWIIDTGSTHHMNGFANAFINIILEGYDDHALVKGLPSGTKAYGRVGICKVVLKDSFESYHQICFEDLLYVPNLLHHHPQIFSVISTCSQDDCQSMSFSV